MGTPGLRKPVALMTEAEKTRALLIDELTGLGSRRAWDDRDRMPARAMLDIEGARRRSGRLCTTCVTRGGVYGSFRVVRCRRLSSELVDQPPQVVGGLT